jgi:PBP4 family serine-type D-alanyl-D-alanine carboxypeptidase
MHLRAFTAILVTVGSSLPPGTQPDASLSARVERIMARPEYKHALWGVEFYDADAGRILYALNEQTLITPGSTTKLLSVGTALTMLGDGHRFHTRVYRTGVLGKDGTLRGDVILVASGDPNLSQRMQPDGSLAFENTDHSSSGTAATRAVPGDPLLVIRELAGHVAAHGITRIGGRVLVDATLFSGYSPLKTGTAVSPISINDNVLDMTIGPGTAVNAPATLTVSPANSYMRFVNRVTTAAAGAREDLEIDDGVHGADGTLTFIVSGTYPLSQQPYLYDPPIPEPAAFAQMVFADALRERGITVDRQVPATAIDFAAAARQYTDANLIAEHVSATAAEMAKVILKVSQNTHADTLPLLLGALFGKANGENGYDIERKWLQKEGLDLSGAQQNDGAGRNAHVTPAFMVSYLHMMSKRLDFQPFYDALPILGKDGTLYDIQTGSAAAGHVHAKTGTAYVEDTLNRKILVTGKGLAGYMTTASGKKLILAIYVNNVWVSDGLDAGPHSVGQVLGEIAAAAYDTVR